MEQDKYKKVKIPYEEVVCICKVACCFLHALGTPLTTVEWTEIIILN